MWCLKENKLAVFEKSGKTYGEGNVQCKVGGKKNTEDLMDMLGLKEAADKLAKVNGMRWYGHVLRQPEEDVLIKTMVYVCSGLKMSIWSTEDEIEVTYQRKHQKDWFKERRCSRLMQVERRCKKSYRSSGMHPTTSSHWGLNWIKTGLTM